MPGILLTLPAIVLGTGIFTVEVHNKIKDLKIPTVPKNFNNPGNILNIGTYKYKGETTTYNGKKNFLTIEDGFSAMGQIVNKYRFTDGLNTPYEIIKKYSGLSDGLELTNYTNFVSQNPLTGFERNEPYFPQFIFNMAKFEQGGNWLKANQGSFLFEIVIRALQKYSNNWVVFKQKNNSQQ